VHETPISIPQPKNDREYKSLVDLLDYLLDKVGEDEKAPLSVVTDLIGTVIASYESTHVPELRNIRQPKSAAQTGTRARRHT
jgi:hypothetical protein